MRRLLTLILCVFVLMMPLHAQDEPVPSLTIDDPNEIPAPMPLIDTHGSDIMNILLLGSDTENPNNSGRTDVIIILSINRTAGSVSMISLPRDLYVYIPDHSVYRINSAFGYGNQSDVGGAALLMATIRYNLGLEIAHYARVDFADFRQIVDALGGVEIAVDCALEDWRLTAPDLDPNHEDSWALFTLPVGVHQLDGDLALWYARSRRGTSDFDRGRRHQALMRALFQRMRTLNLFEQAPELWGQAVEVVETDLDVGDMLGLLPVAATLDPSRFASYTLRPNVEVRSWLSPEGSSVLVPNREALSALLEQAIQPPAAQRLARQNISIELVNASGWRVLPRIAADRLAWEGFVPVISTEPASAREYTVIYDYTGQTKGASLTTLQAAFRVSDLGVIVEPQADRTVDYRIVLGSSFTSCTYNATNAAS